MSKYRFYPWGDWWICESEIRIFPTERKKKSFLEPTVFLFTSSQFKIMIENYRAGNCPITQKGLFRYSCAYGKIYRKFNRALTSWQGFRTLGRLHWRSRP